MDLFVSVGQTAGNSTCGMAETASCDRLRRSRTTSMEGSRQETQHNEAAAAASSLVKLPCSHLVSLCSQSLGALPTQPLHCGMQGHVTMPSCAVWHHKTTRQGNLPSLPYGRSSCPPGDTGCVAWRRPSGQGDERAHSPRYEECAQGGEVKSQIGKSGSLREPRPLQHPRERPRKPADHREGEGGGFKRHVGAAVGAMRDSTHFM